MHEVGPFLKSAHILFVELKISTDHDYDGIKEKCMVCIIFQQSIMTSYKGSY